MAAKSDNGGLLILVLIGAGVWFFAQHSTPVTDAQAVDVDNARAYVAGDFAFAKEPYEEPRPEKTDAERAHEINLETLKIIEDASKGKLPKDEPPAPADGIASIGEHVTILYFRSNQKMGDATSTQALASLAAAGWDTTDEGQIRLVWIENSPQLVSECGVTQPETWVRVAHEQITAKHVGPLNAGQVADFYSTGKIEPVVTSPRGHYVRQCGPNGCQMMWVPE